VTCVRFRFRLFCDRLSVCQSILVSGPIFITVRHLRSSCCWASSVTRGQICNLFVQFAVTLRSKSRRTQDHILLSHLRLPQPGGSGPCIYIPQEQGVQLYLRALGSLFEASYDSQGWLVSKSKVKSQSNVTTDGQSVSMSWCRVHCGTCDSILLSVWKLLCYLCGAPSLTRDRVCPLLVTVTVFSPLSKFNIIFILQITHVLCIYSIYKASVNPGSVQQIMPHHL
jgi:hypothetical protein